MSSRAGLVEARRSCRGAPVLSRRAGLVEARRSCRRARKTNACVRPDIGAVSAGVAGSYGTAGEAACSIAHALASSQVLPPLFARRAWRRGRGGPWRRRAPPWWCVSKAIRSPAGSSSCAVDGAARNARGRRRASLYIFRACPSPWASDLSAVVRQPSAACLLSLRGRDAMRCGPDLDLFDDFVGAVVARELQRGLRATD